MACAFITTNMTHLETIKSIVRGLGTANWDSWWRRLNSKPSLYHGVILNDLARIVSKAVKRWTPFHARCFTA